MRLPQLLPLTLLLPLTSYASGTLDLNYGNVFLNDCGLWNDANSGQGLVLFEGGISGYAAEMTQSGSGVQRVVIRWTADGQPMEVVSDASVGTCGWTVLSQQDGVLAAKVGDLEIRKIEHVGSGWEDASADQWADTWSVGFEFHNAGSTVITDLQVLHTTDPEQDVHLGGDGSTENDRLDTLGLGYDNWAVALPQVSHVAMGYFGCADNDEVGFLLPGASFDEVLIDPQLAAGDLQLAWRSAPVDLDPGRYAYKRFSVVVGADDDARLEPSSPANRVRLNDAAMLAPGDQGSCVLLDWDRDGLVAQSDGGSDCDDGSALIGEADNAWWPDADGDGFGDATGRFESCDATPPFGHVAADGQYDCDDFDPSIGGGDPEVCNAIDDDCDGLVDEDVLTVFYLDADGDGFGDATQAVEGCAAPTPDYAITAGDCDDTDGTVFPGAVDDPDNEIDEDCDGLWAGWRDADGDGYGDAIEVSCISSTCDLDANAVHNADDCDDTLFSVHPGGFDVPGNDLDEDCDGGFAAYEDADGDGVGGGLAALATCLSPTCDGDVGAAMSIGDCDDNDPSISPLAPDIPGNDIDEDCDGDFAAYTDEDGDGYGGSVVECETAACEGVDGVIAVGGDCDDDSALIHPGAIDVAGNDVDEDCDGDFALWVDADGDGYGDPLTEIDCTDLACAGAAANDADCDDTDPSISPDGVEITADGIDQDCDGRWACFRDRDGDGIGGEIAAVRPSNDPFCDAAGESATADDCDDGNRTVFPGADDIPGNDIDEDCDGSFAAYQDADGDGHGDADVIVQSSVSTCDEPGISCTPDDCDDTNADVSPSAEEVPLNEIDEDCSGGVACYLDGDRDGYGVDTLVSSLDDDCDDGGESLTATDCDDNNRNVNPGATEVSGNRHDDDCDGGWACFSDLDGDGYGTDNIVVSADASCVDVGEATTSGDCDDTNAASSPGLAELPGDLIDDNCDGIIECFVDNDGDGFGDLAVMSSADGDCTDPGEAQLQGDCDDTNPDMSPNGVEIVGSEIDSDCDGRSLCWVDEDRDGFGNMNGDFTSIAGRRCRGNRVAPDATDCDDRRPNIFPGAHDVPGNRVDEDCDGAWTCFVDGDGDGFGDQTLDPVVSVDGRCESPGESLERDDCDDTDPSVSPGAEDIPAEGYDRNCDGRFACFSDADGDGVGGTAAEVVVSLDPLCRLNGMSSRADDCDDVDPNVFPGADEVPGSGVDIDCDGLWTCWGDADGDGYGGAGVVSTNPTCTDEGEAEVGGDCDDESALVSPEGVEIVANHIDEDCDGLWACYADFDGDGFGVADEIAYGELPRCVGAGLSWVSNDCDDTNYYAHPGALEVVGNNVDEDCDGRDGGGVTRIEAEFGSPTSCSSAGMNPLWWCWLLLGLGRRRRISP